MKPLLKSTMIAAISAVTGGTIAVAAIKYNPSLQSKIIASDARTTEGRDSLYDDILENQNEIRNQFDSLLDDEFFGTDPFEGMRKMREQMEKRMEEFAPGRRSMTNPFDSWFSDRFGGGTVNDISKREDNAFVYYDIKVEDLNETSINTKVENGYITITGSTEKKNESADNDSSGQSVFKSTFNRTFPLPENVDPNKMEMVPGKNKIVLKFPKKKL